MTEPQTTTAPLDVELTPEHSLQLEAAEEQALAKRIADSDLAYYQRLAGLQQGAEIFKKQNEILEQCRRFAIRQTNPVDWVLFKTKDEAEVAMLAGAGREKVLEVYGVQIDVFPMTEDGRFAPERETLEGGTIQLRAWARFRSRFNNRAETVEATILSTEDFTGRKMKGGRISTTPGDPAFEADLRSALLSRLKNKSARIAAAMNQVPIAELRKAWEGTDKSTDDCRHGSGYGTSAERAAGRVTSEDVAKARKELGEEILRRVGGDESAAKQLLKECTKGDKPGKNGKVFQGFDTVARLTKDWQVEQAWKRLREHPTFGDEATGGSEKEADE